MKLSDKVNISINNSLKCRKMTPSSSGATGNSRINCAELLIKTVNEPHLIASPPSHNKELVPYRPNIIIWGSKHLDNDLDLMNLRAPR